MLNLKELHQRILYPVVRIRSIEVGGSGTVIYSQPNPDNKDEYQSFIMTCAHVIEDAISIKKDWDSVAKKEIKKEFKEQVGVEIFDYVYLSHVNSSNSYKAEIVAYDKQHDLAILRLLSPKQVVNVAELVPEKEIKNIKIFTDTWVSGCSLGHDPLVNPGTVTSLKEMVDQKLYWMGSGNSIFGNSGGAVFLTETGQQIGVTARITVLNLGFGMDIITWMGYMVAPQRIYEFLKEQELRFLFDPNDTYKKAMARRKKKEEKAKLLAVEKDEDEEKDEEEDLELPFK